ncbi:MAG TPA: HAD-IC family P-type ATPase [Candidatus Baltobacteraceae bacterium]|nr:HAD-IC family P-type ATPase [Candidatus Baltobacteraceae bacterium]
MPNERPWHALTADEALAKLGTDPEGLSAEQAADRLAEEGPNELPREKGLSRFFVFLKQFRGALTYVLFAAAAVSLFAGHVFDAGAIVFVVLVNGLIGYVQERKAETAIAKLRDMAVPTAAVRRGGRVERVVASSLVRGDVVVLTEGARIPADLRVLEAKDVRADESPLTGESTPTEKDAEPVEASAAVGDRTSILHMGTLLAAGEAVGVVVETGVRTEFGRIAGELMAIKRERTPFERRLDRMALNLGVIAVAAAGLIFIVGLKRDLPVIDTFLFAVAAAVSSIPEGLPFVLVLVLSVGVRRMARRNAITRHLPAVETLGIVDVICTDKTGTLTENKMTVREIGMLDHAVQVTGEGWASEGEFLVDGARIHLGEHPVLNHVLRAAAICAKAAIQVEGGRAVAVGDPTEAALVALGRKGGFDRARLGKEERTLDEVPFSSGRKFRAVLHDYVAANGIRRREIMAVGAFEVLSERAAMTMSEKGPDVLTPELRAKFEALHEVMASKAMRVIAVAVREVDAGTEELRAEDVRELSLLGLVGMIDPPRPGIRAALARCRQAGIRVIMNTGDHKGTAIAIAREIGLLESGAEGRVFTDAEVASMSEERFRAAVKDAVIFARVTPETKSRVVDELQRVGHVVAMTGDGINDAPALKSADVGVAMGITGTDVTKEVADMVLADDDFSSIVSAVEEGRVVFHNVKQTTGFLVMTNAGEIVTMLSTLALGLPLPLLPAQLLWLNVVTDALTDEALALEPKHGGELLAPPRRKDARILSRSLIILIALTSALMAAGTLILFRMTLDRDGLDRARAMAFLSMSFFQLWNVFNMRSTNKSLFTLGFLSNRWIPLTIALSAALMAMIMYVPAFQPAFRLAPLGLGEWALAVAVSSSVLWLVEGYKILVRRGIVPPEWI